MISIQDSMTIADRFIITLRIIQPARVQDIADAYIELWAGEESENLRSVIYSIHDRMRAQGMLLSVRRGTYILNSEGMAIAARFMKERAIDNRRMFLMKRQRRLYH